MTFRLVSTLPMSDGCDVGYEKCEVATVNIRQTDDRFERYLVAASAVLT